MTFPMTMRSKVIKSFPPQNIIESTRITRRKKEVRKDRKNKEMWMICQMVDHQMYYAGEAKCNFLSRKESQIIHVDTQDDCGRGRVGARKMKISLQHFMGGLRVWNWKHFYCKFCSLKSNKLLKFMQKFTRKTKRCLLTKTKIEIE